MPVVVAPSTQAIPGGTATLPNLVYTSTLKAGDQLVCHIASATRDPGVTRTDYDGFMVRQGSAAGPALFNPNCLYAQTNLSFTFTMPIDAPIWVTIEGGGEPKDSSHGTAFGWSLELIPVTTGHCQYGVELTNPGQFIYYVTPGLLDVALAELGLPWMAPLFTAFYFSQVDAAVLCGDDPPAPTPFDQSTWTAGLIEKKIWLDAILWHHLCRCKPGTPAPIPFPPPSATQPPGGPIAPTFPCDPSQLCASLVAIQQQLAVVLQTTSQDYQLDTLTQRYGNPFASLNGAVHSNISTSGTFAVSRLLGVMVDVTEYPPDNRTFTGVPTYVTDLGWMSILTGDGMIDEIRLTRSKTIWLPRLMPYATQLGISLREGVVVRVTELEAEP